ncbi:glycoside hydrolase family 97 catalytic domain-containing protein [Streptomyces himalayensis]|uniref:Glycoside hydrolase family 97 catalytic domain-containing protein n=1 Tax=Streptomyces himalayensis subsp. himalayensis TaxID=2756131 RepID=A0A7W0DGQ5_9ACTN|nr:glycoside hydrolase family 97 catalytic domain-containing protein [Streptomyces himalayensis]MBA2944723.1 glycoside hydrolase family 97 catalytic domain-containing protein [Streptomyces himalayensis subsp. himalayensis]
MPAQARFRAMMLTLCSALLATAATALPASAETASWEVSAHDGPTAVVGLDADDGRPTLAVRRDGRTVIEPSPVGLVTENVDLSGGLSLTGRSDRTITERYEAATGKSRIRNVKMAESRFSFRGTGGARLDLVVRAAADGVAYRYVLPDTGTTGDVLREASAFTLPTGSDAVIGPYRPDNELRFTRYGAAAAPTGSYMMQALFRTAGGYALVAESDLTGSYAGARLTHDAGSSTYRVALWNDEPVEVSGGTLTTPWRAIVTGDLATVTESTFTDDLAPASRIRDTSWVRPGPALWTWLAGGKEAGVSLEAQRKYVDYAAERGWPYEVVDAGWYFLPDQWDVIDPDWQRTSWIPELVRYAADRGVGIHVWLHYTLLTDPVEREKWLSTLEKWGVEGVKIDFMDSESQDRMRWYDEVLQSTADHHLMVNFHGSTIPKGIQRTWPHVLTFEGVGGEEKRTNTAEHLAALPFTRNVIGSMDFTPGAFHRPYRPNVGSDAGELGLSVLYESGIQNLAGTPESYDARPEARRYLEQIPAAWEETRLLTGDPGVSAVLARRAADGRWFIGGTFAGAAHTVDVPMRLGAGRWLVETVTDGPSGLVREPHVVSGGDTLSVPVVTDGGFAAIACRWYAGRTACDD